MSLPSESCSLIFVLKIGWYFSIWVHQDPIIYTEVLNSPFFIRQIVLLIDVSDIFRSNLLSSGHITCNWDQLYTPATDTGTHHFWLIFGSKIVMACLVIALWTWFVKCNVFVILVIIFSFTSWRGWNVWDIVVTGSDPCWLIPNHVCS